MLNESTLIKLIFNYSAAQSPQTSQSNHYRISLDKIAKDFSGYPMPPSTNVDLESIKSSYVAGVFFMLCVIGLLLYVNLYYEYCFRDSIIELTETRMCFCLKYCLIVRRSKNDLANSLKGESLEDCKNSANINNINNNNLLYADSSSSNCKQAMPLQSSSNETYTHTVTGAVML